MSRLRNAVAGATALGVATIGVVGGFEGYKAKSYRDIVGVWTVCYGETKNIGPGMTFTKGQCDAMFLRSLVAHETGMRNCLKNPDALPDRPYLAFVSFTYNLGVGAFCKSTIRRKIDAGDVKGACNELLKWDRAGGRVVKGLTMRRSQERKLCLSSAK